MSEIPFGQMRWYLGAIIIFISLHCDAPWQIIDKTEAQIQQNGSNIYSLCLSLSSRLLYNFFSHRIPAIDATKNVKRQTMLLLAASFSQSTLSICTSFEPNDLKFFMAYFLVFAER